MKPLVFCSSFIFGSFFLFCTQIALLKYEPNLSVNFLLIAYVYTLSRNFAPYIIALFIFMLDMYLFLQTGTFYAISPILAALSWIFLKIQNDFYNKLVLPCMLIFSYKIIESLYFFITLHFVTTPAQFIESVILNGIIFILLWLITRQPLHH